MPFKYGTSAFPILVLIPIVLYLYGSWRSIHQLQRTLGILTVGRIGIRENITATNRHIYSHSVMKEQSALGGVVLTKDDESINTSRQWWTSESVNVHTNRTISLPSSGSPPTLFWHVGPHKTSTTAIQSFLAAHKKVLLEKDNIEAPWVLPGRFHGAKNAANVAMCLSGRVNSKEMTCQQVLQSFQHFVAGARANSKNIVLSAEGFSFCNKPQIHQFVQDYFAGWEIQVIVFHRRFDEWLTSLHFEMNRHNIS